MSDLHDASDSAPAGGLLTLRQYAEYVGVAPSTISRQIDQGVITPEGTDTDGAFLIDPKKADAERAQKLNQAHVSAHAEKKGGADRGGDLQRARTAKEGYAARLTQLQYEREIGNLLDKQEVHDAFFELGQMMREELQRRAPLLAQQLVGMQDAAAIQALIEAEHRKALESVIASIGARLQAEAPNVAA